MDRKLSISKLDAAKRQLEVAIRLYFSNDDPVSLHTLTAAAYNILRDISHNLGAERMLVKDKIFDWIKPEGIDIFRERTNEAENFFKHADRDHNSILEYDSVQVELLILDACSQYSKLSSEDPPLFRIYRIWFIANNQGLFNFPSEQVRALASNASEIVQMGRLRFFQEAISLMLFTKA